MPSANEDGRHGLTIAEGQALGRGHAGPWRQDGERYSVARQSAAPASVASPMARFDDGAVDTALPDGAPIVTLRLAGALAQELLVNGRSVPVPRSLPRTVAPGDSGVKPGAVRAGPLAAPSFYLRRALPAEAATAADLHRFGASHVVDGQPAFDPIVAQLGTCLLAALEESDRSATPLVDYVALAIHAHIVHAYRGVPAPPCPTRGRLASWQERYAKEMLGGNLERNVALSDLAVTCGLSLSHFSRAFKRSTGQPPHRWRTMQRVGHGKRLLATSALPLADIALACGFADQSHFTRVFSRDVGCGPAAWRRAHVTPAGRSSSP
jgi:AraC family transcriptional regulator